MQAYDGSTWFSTFIGRAMKRTLNKTNGPFTNELCDSKQSIADIITTTFINISIPNKDTSAMMLVDYILNSDEGAGYYRTGQLRINVSRNEGSNTNSDINETIAGETTPSSTIGTISVDANSTKIYQHCGFDAAISTSFSSPSTGPYGVAWDSGNTKLYSCDANSDDIYRHCGFSSTIGSCFSSPSTAPDGVAWDGTNLLSSDGVTDKIYQHSTFTDTISDSFSSPSDTPMGIYWDSAGGKLYSADATTDKIYRHTAFSATIADSFSSPSSGLFGVAYDGVNVLSSDNGSGKIYRHSTFTTTIRDSFSTPSDLPTGIDFRYTTGDIDSVLFSLGALSGAASAAQTLPLQVKAKAMPTNTLNIRYFARILSGGYQDGESGCEVTLAAA